MQQALHLTAPLNAATWGAELAVAEGRGRVYAVEPTGAVEDNPNLTDKKYPGNPTKSYRSRISLRVTGEVADWTAHPAQEFRTIKPPRATQGRGVEATED